MNVPDIFISSILGIVLLITVSVASSLIARALRVPFPIILVMSGVCLTLLPELPAGISIFYEPDIAEKTILFVFLPLLVFEAAYKFDFAKFTANWSAIMIMAIPGVMFSTLIITATLVFIGILTPQTALILGIILSATDPSATIAIFKESGAPKDLITIVEGESLFNDATVIAAYKIAVLIFAMHLTPTDMVVTGLWQFTWVFFVGALCGYVTGHLLLWLMKALPDDPYIEISISLVTAIGCFVAVEQFVHASSIVALTICGLVLAKNTPLPISNESNQYLNSFWTYLSDLAKAMIFILVGLWLNLELIASHWLNTLLVIISMLAARAGFVYWILPFFGRLSRLSYSLPRSYQHICLWGGLRGAVTLALSILVITDTSLFAIEERETMLAVAMGAVFFTILIQGLTLSPLASRLKLDETSIEEKITKKELMLSAMKASEKVLAHLAKTPLADSGAPDEIMQSLKSHVDEEKRDLRHLYTTAVDTQSLYKKLIMEGLSIESEYLYLLYDQGLISMESYQKHREFFDQQMDAARHKYQQPNSQHAHKRSLRRALDKWTHKPTSDVSIQYELAWSRLLTTDLTLIELKALVNDYPVEPALKKQVLQVWASWRQQSADTVSQLDKTYPVITATAHRKWLHHMLNTVQKAHLEKFVRQRLISESDKEQIVKQLMHTTSSFYKDSVDNIRTGRDSTHSNDDSK
ncbi:sodium:proton antiporter [Vibrio sp. EJY3]|uniref:cation:proton antiporter n=1 Tax=Vibrio sp. (strain EJY3) TaxID=1116375 RepID=UPI000243B79E|nr:sodium:proton antiporter [Vibrio sp. EJY3]AEX24877.1 sodium/hydrogen exchanger [Vibrio sp. EJY3]